MKNFNKFFSTTKRAALSILCIATLLIGIGSTTAFAVSKASKDDMLSETKVISKITEPKTKLDTNTTKVNETQKNNSVSKVTKSSVVDKVTTEKTTVYMKPTTTLKTISTKQSSALISTATAKSKALSNAGVKASDVLYISTQLDMDDGIQVYDIEFNTSNAEYDYTINAKTGKILDKDIDYFKSVTTKTTTKTNNNNSLYISVAEAKEIALLHSGLNASQITFTKAKIETDDGIKVYEIEFFSGMKEYEYTINAKTGKIIDFDCDIND